MKLYLKYVSIRLKSQMRYRTFLFLTAVCQLLTSFAAFLSIHFLFERLGWAGSFAYTEVLLCFAAILVSFSLAECLAGGFDAFPGMLGSGEFDRILVRPRSLFLQVLGSKAELSRIGRLILALIALAYAIPECGVPWTWDRILTLSLMIVSGFFIIAGLFIVHASLCFFTTEGLGFMSIFTGGSRAFDYPFPVSLENVLKFFAYVIPLALLQYYPFLCLIGRSENRLYLLPPLAALLFLIPCCGLWRLGLRHYQSTGLNKKRFKA